MKLRFIKLRPEMCPIWEATSSWVLEIPNDEEFNVKLRAYEDRERLFSSAAAMIADPNSITHWKGPAWQLAARILDEAEGKLYYKISNLTPLLTRELVVAAANRLQEVRCAAAAYRRTVRVSGSLCLYLWGHGRMLVATKYPDSGVVAERFYGVDPRDTALPFYPELEKKDVKIKEVLICESHPGYKTVKPANSFMRWTATVGGESVVSKGDTHWLSADAAQREAASHFEYLTGRDLSAEYELR